MKNLDEIDVKEISENGTTVEIIHPYSDKPIGMEIDIVGLQSESAQAVYRRFRARAIERQQKRKVQKPEDQDREAIELAAAITRGWRSWDETKDREDAEVVEYIPWQGEELKCSESAALRVYRKHQWIAAQVIEAAGERSRFLGE